MCTDNLGILTSKFVNFCSFRCHLYKNTGLDQESNSIREVRSRHSPEGAALQAMLDISNKGEDVSSPDKNNSLSQTMHSSSFDIRFNPDIFSPGAWASE